MNQVLAVLKSIASHLADYEVALIALSTTLVAIQGDLVQLGASQLAVALVVRDVALIALIVQKVVEGQQAPVVK